MNKMSIFAARRMIRPPQRVMRGPEDHGNQPGGGDNQQVNPGDSSTDSNDSNNNSEEFDAEAFWRGPAEDEQGNPTPGGSVDPANPSSGTDNQDDTATQLTNQLNNLNFGALFDDSIVSEINEGNFDNFNTRMNQHLRNTVQQSLVMNVQIMRAYGDRIIAQMREEMAGTFDGRDDQAQLVKDFSAAADPRVAPIIQSVFDQALKNTKGNRVEATKQTKQMIALMAKQTGNDLQLNVAPRGPNDSPPTPPTNWLDELMGRD